MKKLVSLLFVFLFSQFSFAQALGDYMDIDGVPGFIFYLDESGEHGMVMSFSAYSAKQAKQVQKYMEKNLKNLAKDSGLQSEGNATTWDINKLIIPEKSKEKLSKKEWKQVWADLIPQLSDYGEQNAKIVKDYCAEKNISLQLFPHHYWASTLGEGWFIPGDEELRLFAQFFCGGVGKEYGLGQIKWYKRSNELTNNMLVAPVITAITTYAIHSSSVRTDTGSRGLVVNRPKLGKTYFQFYDSWGGSPYDAQCAVKRF
ncbi:MAG: hypothetical protein ACI3YC_02650 [Alloprevotella sp.]